MEATHFIEAYKHKCGAYVNTTVTTISNLESYLAFTRYSKGKTIAIFKIKYK